MAKGDFFKNEVPEDEAPKERKEGNRFEDEIKEHLDGVRKLVFEMNQLSQEKKIKIQSFNEKINLIMLTLQGSAKDSEGLMTKVERLISYPLYSELPSTQPTKDVISMFKELLALMNNRHEEIQQIERRKGKYYEELLDMYKGCLKDLETIKVRDQKPTKRDKDEDN